MAVASPTHTRDLARRVRAHAVRMVAAARASHIGSCLSIADMLAVLYGGFLRVAPGTRDAPDRDRLILSKGHAAAVLYAVLAERGFIQVEELATYCQEGSRLAGHASHHVPGVELSTGSLGHGLSVGCGIALAGKRDGQPYRVVVIVSDGECDEGSIWEAALFAPHHELDNLIVLVDFNRIQSFGRVEDVLRLEPFPSKWESFGWGVRRVDGHDHDALAKALADAPLVPGRPTVIVADTVKGKGVTFMEDKLEWHYRSPSSEQLELALKELGEEP
jgi:transketolase